MRKGRQFIPPRGLPDDTVIDYYLSTCSLCNLQYCNVGEPTRSNCLTAAAASSRSGSSDLSVGRMSTLSRAASDLAHCIIFASRSSNSATGHAYGASPLWTNKKLSTIDFGGYGPCASVPVRGTSSTTPHHDLIQ